MMMNSAASMRRADDARRLSLSESACRRRRAGARSRQDTQVAQCARALAQHTTHHSHTLHTHAYTPSQHNKDKRE